MLWIQVSAKCVNVNVGALVDKMFLDVDCGHGRKMFNRFPRPHFSDWPAREFELATLQLQFWVITSPNPKTTTAHKLSVKDTMSRYLQMQSFQDHL